MDRSVPQGSGKTQSSERQEADSLSAIEEWREKHRLEVLKTETYRSLQNVLSSGTSQVRLDTGFDFENGYGSGTAAKLTGEKGGVVILYEWDNVDENRKFAYRSVPKEATRQLGIALAERLEKGDTAKLMGDPGEDELIHTTEPQRVLKVLAELGVDCERAVVEEPSQGFKRFTIRFGSSSED